MQSTHALKISNCKGILVFYHSQLRHREMKYWIVMTVIFFLIPLQTCSHNSEIPCNLLWLTQVRVELNGTGSCLSDFLYYRIFSGVPIMSFSPCWEYWIHIFSSLQANPFPYIWFVKTECEMLKCRKLDQGTCILLYIPVEHLVAS